MIPYIIDYCDVCGELTVLYSCMLCDFFTCERCNCDENHYGDENYD